MSQQPENPDAGIDSSLDSGLAESDAQGEQLADAGIDSSLDSGLAESDAQGEQLADADLQSGTSQRTDPDDPEAAIEEATERSRGED